MSERITFKMRDGTTKIFQHVGRPGGSYTISLKFEPGFATVTDEWYKRTCIPTDLIAEIIEEPGR